MIDTFFDDQGVGLPTAYGTTMKRGRHFIDGQGVDLPTACGTTMKHNRHFIDVPNCMRYNDETIDTLLMFPTACDTTMKQSTLY